MTNIIPPRSTSILKTTPDSTKHSAVDLEALSLETGVPVDMLRTFAAISDPANKHLFTAESAYQAFAGVAVRGRPT